MIKNIIRDHKYKYKNFVEKSQCWYSAGKRANSGKIAFADVSLNYDFTSSVENHWGWEILMKI